MILYIDTSALVKRYVSESGSLEVGVLIDQAEVVGTTLLTQVEMASAFARAARMKWIGNAEADHAWRMFLTDWKYLVRMPLSSTVMDRAAVMVQDHALRAYDAVHLAAAVMWQEMLQEQVTLLTYDRELWAAARNLGLLVAPQVL